MARQLSRTRTAPAALDPQDGTGDQYDDDTESRRGNSRRSESRLSQRPQRSSRRTEEAEDDGDDDNDRAPARGRSAVPSRKRQSSALAARESARGWDNYKKAKARGSRYNDADKFAVEEGEEELIVFLEEDPFETWNEHFIRELDGKKSFACLEDDCPLCAIGDNPGYRAAFNVAVFDAKGNPVVKYWIATPGPLDEIEEHAFSDRTGPLNRPGNYYVVSKKKGKNKFFKYKVERITADQVLDQFGFDPLDDDELEALGEILFESKDVLKLDSRAKLSEAARELDS